jgi:hypothetical protein
MQQLPHVIANCSRSRRRWLEELIIPPLCGDPLILLVLIARVVVVMVPPTVDARTGLSCLNLLREPLDQ